MTFVFAHTVVWSIWVRNDSGECLINMHSPHKRPVLWSFYIFSLLTWWTCWKAVEFRVIWDALVLTWRHFKNKCYNEKNRKWHWHHTPIWSNYTNGLWYLCWFVQYVFKWPTTFFLGNVFQKIKWLICRTLSHTNTSLEDQKRELKQYSMQQKRWSTKIYIINLV